MNPAILMQILQGAAATGAQTFRAIPTIVPTQYEKENKKRLSTLKELMESGALGLTEEEKARIYETQSAGLEKQIQASEQAAAQLAAASASSGAGQALKASTALQAQAGASRQAINRDVAALDQQRKAQMEQEYWARQQADSQAKQNRLAAVMSIPAAGLEAIAGTGAVNQMVAGGAGEKDMQAALVAALSKEGVSEEDARRLIAAFGSNPNMISMAANALKGGK